MSCSAPALASPTDGPADLLVVGGGPAGLSAAVTAAGLGLRVTVVDERPTLGGQIYKQPPPGYTVRDESALGRDQRVGRALISAVRATNAEILVDASVLHVLPGRVVLSTGQASRTLQARRILLAPGGYDRPVAFDGWTLPGVVTAGGAQTLAKIQGVAPGERVVFAGSGPVALAFPAQLQRYGVHVELVCQPGPPPRAADVARILRAARGNLHLLRDAVVYGSILLRGRVPMRYRRIVVRAEGSGRVERVVHAAVDGNWRPLRGTEEVVKCDTLCLGYGFSSSVELVRLAGCNLTFDEGLGGHFAVVDDWMRTSVPGVLCAGDGRGVEGAYVAADEGRLAGLGAALDLGALDHPSAITAAEPIRRRLRRKRLFQDALAPLHAVGAGVYELAGPQTVVCRCEEVTRVELEKAAGVSSDPSFIKGITRAGMGLCQGRNCHSQVAAIAALAGGSSAERLPAPTPRFPVRPIPLGAVADLSANEPRLFATPEPGK